MTGIAGEQGWRGHCASSSPSPLGCPARGSGPPLIPHHEACKDETAGGSDRRRMLSPASSQQKGQAIPKFRGARYHQFPTFVQNYFPPCILSSPLARNRV